MFKPSKFFIGTALGMCLLLIPQASFAKKKPSKKVPQNKPAATFEYSGPAISFEQMFQNPDDNDLKLNYARQQATAGDFLSAAAALEGMLYISPNWDSARLFYAIVLAELDDSSAAIYEFNILKSRPLSVTDRAISNAYLEKLKAEKG